MAWEGWRDHYNEAADEEKVKEKKLVQPGTKKVQEAVVIKHAMDKIMQAGYGIQLRLARQLGHEVKGYIRDTIWATPLESIQGDTTYDHIPRYDLCKAI